MHSSHMSFIKLIRIPLTNSNEIFPYNINLYGSPNIVAVYSP